MTLPSRSAYLQVHQGANFVCPREGQDPPLRFGCLFRYRVTPKGAGLSPNVRNGFAVGHADKLQFETMSACVWGCQKINVYILGKLCYNTSSMRRVGSPGRLKTLLRLARFSTYNRKLCRRLHLRRRFRAEGAVGGCLLLLHILCHH